MKKVLILLMMMLGIIQAHAKEAYAVFENGTLTLYYDDARSSRSGTVYSVPNKTCGLPSLPNEWSPTIIGGIPPGHPWHEKSEETNKIVFDPSFAEYKPTISYGWFTCFNANSIQGLEYLNTSEVTDMRYMFAGCEYLTQLDLTHLSISENALSSNLCEACLKLESVSLGNSVKNIGEQAFYWCLKLGSIAIPKTVLQIGDNVFGRCDNLASISVEEGNPNYDSRGGCNALINTSTNELMRGTISTVIPNGITAIGEHAFSLLTLNGINIPNSVSQIKRNAFYGVRGITEITIPNSVSEIGESALKTDGLVTINSLIEHPFPISSNCFSDKTKQNGTLNIPYGTMSLYDVCEGWNEFANIVDPSGEKKKEKYAFLKDGVLTYCYDGEKANREGEILELYRNGSTGDYGDLRVNIDWNRKGEIKKVVFLPSFAVIKPQSLKGLFRYLTELSEIEGLQYINTSEVTNMSNMFNGCAVTSLDVSHFNTSNVTDMSGIFRSCRKLTSLDLSNFNTSNVINMYGMFSSCESLTSLDLSNFNTSNVTNMGSMFEYCSSLTSLDVSNFNTSNVTDMSSMFHGCSSLTSLDVSNFNTSNVINMSSMFDGCSSLTSLDVSNFNTSNVTDMSSMFSKCNSLTSLDVSNFNTSKVTYMRSMFNGCSSLTSLDISSFNTSNVTNMRDMFSGCRSLTSLDVSHFNTSNVTDMCGIFSSCSSLTSLDISSFNTSNVTNMSSMFDGCSSLTSLDLSNFNTSKITYMENMFRRCSALKSFVIPNTFTLIGRSAFYECSSLEKVTIPNTVKSIGQEAFYNCVSLKEVICNIEEPFAINENAFMNKADGTEVFTSAILTVPQGTKELYQNTDGWKRFAYISDGTSIAPVDEGDNTDYGNGEIDVNTNLNGNVVGNIYYNISDDSGEYSSTEGCIILRKPTSDTDMNNLEGQDIFGEDFKNGFTGIVFMVQGSGTVKVNAETVGNMTLKVKFGNNAPVTMELEGKMKASFPYSVSEPTYVYIYGGETQTANARGLRAASSDNALKIYGIEWSEEASSIESIYGVSNADAVIYNLQGQRLQTVTKGINIVNGKKVIIK